MKNRPELRTENLRCDLSPNEKQDLSEKLVRMLLETEEAEESRSEFMTDWKARMESLTKLVKRYTNMLAKGYEYRDIDCRVMYNTPHSGWKTLFRPDTGEVVREEQMTDDERQENLPLENAVNIAPEIADGFQLAPPDAPTESAPAMPPPVSETPISGKDAAAND
jgi:hypothetical protein